MSGIDDLFTKYIFYVKIFITSFIDNTDDMNTNILKLLEIVDKIGDSYDDNLKDVFKEHIILMSIYISLIKKKNELNNNDDIYSLDMISHKLSISSDESSISKILQSSNRDKIMRKYKNILIKINNNIIDIAEIISEKKKLNPPEKKRVLNYLAINIKYINNLAICRLNKKYDEEIIYFDKLYDNIKLIIGAITEKKIDRKKKLYKLAYILILIIVIILCWWYLKKKI